MSAVTGPGSPIRVHTLIDSLSWGGAEMLLADLAAAAPQAGIELSVGYLLEINGSPAAAGLRALGVEPEHVTVKRLLDPAGVMRLRRHLKRVKPDIIHTHLSMADSIVHPVARSLGIPSVSTIHVIAREPTGWAADATMRGAQRTRVAAFARRHAATRVIAVSDAARTAYLSTGWDTPEHVLTVRNGITRSIPADGAHVRAQLGIDADALVVTTVSVLRPGKGHEVAIKAVRSLLPRFPALRLLILGDGPARADIARDALELGDAVVMPGHRDDVMSVLGATDVVLHVTDMDAFPTALIEAAAMGLPAVATDVGGIPEIVEPGVTGLLVASPPSVEQTAAALAQLLDDAELRRRLGTRAREVFDERFTAERWAHRLRAVYEEIRSEPRR
jgi:glycosyltransferase involved in cell wall biosynthesis